MITQENIPYTADEIKVMVKTCEKYNSALSRATFYNGELPTENQRKMLLDIFPELVADNDEKIRKEIVDFITSSNKYGTNERCEAWLAWLEKKELKKVEVANNESEDERIRKGIIRNLQYLMDRSEGFVQEDLQERITWLENQCEQKQTWKPSAAQLIVIEDLVKDKNTSNVYKVILRGMLDEFKQLTNTEI